MKYSIIIGENSELSKRVQRALFKAGFVWGSDGSCRVKYTDKRIINLNTNQLGVMSYPGLCNIKDLKNECLRGHRILWPSDVLSGATELDGSKKLVKEMSVDQVSKALGYEVKIVKSEAPIVAGSIVKFKTVDKIAVSIDYAKHFNTDDKYEVDHISRCNNACINGWYVRVDDLYLV